MKKVFFKLSALIVALAVMFSFPVGFMTGCSPKAKDTIVLRVCNWEDYIWEDEEGETDYENMCDKFEHYMADRGVNVSVEYSTFGTNENLYNDLKIAGGYLYDVVCPSDYMIEKMAREGMLEKLTDIDNYEADGTYSRNVSPYIKEIFENDISWKDEKGEKASLADYAVGYMWGTMGYVYKPAFEGIEEDMKDWTSVWNERYRHLVTIKDSVRDSYFIGIAYVYKDELLQLKNDVESGVITQEEYKDSLTEIFNRTDEDTVAKVEECLSALKDNLFGFEVDSGKNDIVTGKIVVYFAWSGDAVYAMDEAESDEENPVELYYSVPEEGSNVWFDGWCIPKNAQQKEVALDFINFLADPENAILNMEYIGYTTVIAGENDEILDWAIDTYELETEPVEGYSEVDLSYFFGNSATVYTEVTGRQFSTQFPTGEVIDRCVFMHYFDDETNERINLMWENIKGFALPLWAIILIVIAIALLIVLFVLLKFRERIFKKSGGTYKTEKPRHKNLKVISREEIR